MRRQQGGFSYMEALLAAVIVLAALVPALDALKLGLGAAAVHEAAVADHYRLASRLEEVLAEPFGSLDLAAAAAGSETVPSSYSDPAGPPDRLLVFLSRYDSNNADGDGDGFTGKDDDLIWVRVNIAGSVAELQALVAQ